MVSVRAGDAVVEVDLAGVLAAVRRFREEYDDVYLVFRPGGAWPEALDPRLREALLLASAYADDRSGERRLTGVDANQVGAQGLDPSPFGPTLWLDYPGDTVAETRSWLADLAQNLAAAGFSGTIGPFTELDLPDPMYDRASPSKLTAYGGFSMADGETLLRRAAAWCLAQPHDVVRLDVGVNSIALPPIGAGDYLAALLAQGEAAGLTCWSEGEPPARRISALPGRHEGRHDGRHDGRAAGSWQVHGPAAGWRLQLDELLTEMVSLASYFDLALVRRERSWTRGGWAALDYEAPEPPAAPGLSLRADEFDHRTPDACGAQILTGAHLDRATDLSGWLIETVAPGRYLVVARDLGSWFAGAPVPGEVLAAARRDFGAMILAP